MNAWPASLAGTDSLEVMGGPSFPECSSGASAGFLMVWCAAVSSGPAENADHDVLAPKSRMEVPPARSKSVLILLHILSG